ncbi:MAG: ribonuclease P protein component [Tepidisphaera sp.]|nr:ribonuclease P protein component [Tepidisphaera sp.]
MPLLFRPDQRLRHALEFQRVYAAKSRKVRGPLAAFAVPNALPKHRLGLAVGRPVGNAVRRARVKRLIREAFRLSQNDLPRRDDGAYDIIISPRAHNPMPLSEYQSLLLALAADLHKEWDRRAARNTQS